MTTEENMEERTNLELSSTSQEPTPSENEFPESGPRANLVVAGAFATCFCTAGYVNSFGTFFNYYTQNQLSDVPKQEIALIGSLMWMFMLTVGKISGPWFDKEGARRVMIPGAAGLILSVIFTGLCTEYYGFLHVQGIFGGISCGLLFTPAIAILAHNFSKNRAKATSLAISGSSLGALIIPVVLDLLLGYLELSFSWALGILGFIFSALLIFACVAIKERLPYNRKPRNAPERSGPIVYCAVVVLSFHFVQAYAPFSQVVTYAERLGFSPQKSASVQYVIYLASFLGQVIGWELVDENIQLVHLILALVANRIIHLFWHATTAYNSAIFAALYGLSLGPIITLSVAGVVRTAPDRRISGTYIGTRLMALGFGVFVGNFIMDLITRTEVGELTSAVLWLPTVMSVLGIPLTVILSDIFSPPARPNTDTTGAEHEV